VSSPQVVAVLGRGVVPAGTPVLRPDDLGVLRGDGVFETLRLRDGRPWLLSEHLNRLAGSASRLDLALPPAEVLADLVGQVCARWPAEAEGALRLVCTRGHEEGGPVTVYAIAGPVSPVALIARRDGLHVLTATLGMALTARQDAPWLLGGAKTLSYAVNMASQRWAAAHEADDVLWVSADGYALEAPTSTLVWLTGDEVCTVPAESTGILRGTTAAYLLDHVAEVGLRPAQRLVRPARLSTMDAVWFVSSVRGLVEVRTLDGVPMARSPRTAELRKLLGY
jgi:4-amino-4-deoxychorismate lyase